MSTPEKGSGSSPAGAETRPAPVVFISHGSPMVALDGGVYSQALARFGESFTPQAIVAISAYWEHTHGVQITAADRPKLIYDFGGFPPALYDLTYEAAGDPALAREVQAALGENSVAATLDPERGWDHGVWIPLRLMYAQALAPIVQISLPLNSSPEQLFRIGEALARFRNKGVLIVASGGLVHNLQRIRADRKDSPPHAWAEEFDKWAKEAIERKDFPALFSYRRFAPHAKLAVPTSEHLAPLFVALGAARPYSQVVAIFEGFQYASISMRCFALES
ncbi:MAG: dioxygenase [Acidobacteriia bacterium]|nr:dioxygenase [Terriglobia bacterium]